MDAGHPAADHHPARHLLALGVADNAMPAKRVHIDGLVLDALDLLGKDERRSFQVLPTS